MAFALLRNFVSKKLSKVPVSEVYEIDVIHRKCCVLTAKKNKYIKSAIDYALHIGSKFIIHQLLRVSDGRCNPRKHHLSCPPRLSTSEVEHDFEKFTLQSEKELCKSDQVKSSEVKESRKVGASIRDKFLVQAQSKGDNNDQLEGGDNHNGLKRKVPDSRNDIQRPKIPKAGDSVISPDQAEKQTKIVEAEGSLEENLKLRQELELMKKSLQESLQTIVSKEVQKIPNLVKDLQQKATPLVDMDSIPDDVSKEIPDGTAPIKEGMIYIGQDLYLSKEIFLDVTDTKFKFSSRLNELVGHTLGSKVNEYSLSGKEGKVQIINSTTKAWTRLLKLMDWDGIDIPPLQKAKNKKKDGAESAVQRHGVICNELVREYVRHFLYNRKPDTVAKLQARQQAKAEEKKKQQETKEQRAKKKDKQKSDASGKGKKLKKDGEQDNAKTEQEELNASLHTDDSN